MQTLEIQKSLLTMNTIAANVAAQAFGMLSDYWEREIANGEPAHKLLADVDAVIELLQKARQQAARQMGLNVENPALELEQPLESGSDYKLSQSSGHASVWLRMSSPISVQVSEIGGVVSTTIFATTPDKDLLELASGSATTASAKKAINSYAQARTHVNVPLTHKDLVARMHQHSLNHETASKVQSGVLDLDLLVDSGLLTRDHPLCLSQSSVRLQFHGFLLNPALWRQDAVFRVYNQQGALEGHYSASAFIALSDEQLQ